MTELVNKYLCALRSGEYKKQRVEYKEFNVTDRVGNLPPDEINVTMNEIMMEGEEPLFLDGDIFGFNRRQTKTPYCFKSDGHKMTPMSGGSNTTPNYRRAMDRGLDGVLAELEHYRRIYEADDEKQRFYAALTREVENILRICDRYRTAAREKGIDRLADALERVPRRSPESFYEACIFLKILIYALRCAGGVHITLGRFDQYMLSYYEADRARGVGREELFETLELLFISLNVDGDLYIGVQQGDNGQSMVLGGFDGEGRDCFNELSALCMDASIELSLIDPKINLRVGKNTPDWMYEYGTKLTKKGLGFPQYCNDDVIVPYMISLGYDREDALNYTVAACWEVISPGNGCDIPNIANMNFPLVVNRAIHKHLTEVESFEELISLVRNEIADECAEIQGRFCPGYSTRISLMSLLVDGCVESGRDTAAGGAKYRNYGCHGIGIATAADSLAAVKRAVFDEKQIGAEELLAALNADFEGYEPLRHYLLSCPKMGNNDDYVDSLAAELMDAFEDHMHKKPNGGGGVWRAGTGSAMEYVLSAKACPATADGRHAADVFGCSFSPSITTRLDGPLSVIQSFTKHDLRRIANGGPLTLELHDTVFRNEEGEKKVSQLVKAFIHLGGHQLQLNAINRDRLQEAREHPEKYPNLIVRVWGWSGYFCELAPEYQEHIIRRTEFQF